MSEPDFQYQNPKDQRDTTVPIFSMSIQANGARSEAEGRPCFDDVEMVEIIVPGLRGCSSYRIVMDEHRQRWPKEYAAFKSGQESPLDGTPLSELPSIAKSQVEELKFRHVRSIETLAALSDAQLAGAVSMGGMALRDKAKRWLDTTAGALKEEKLAAENRAKDAKISELETKLADLVKRMDAMPAQAAPQA